MTAAIVTVGRSGRNATGYDHDSSYSVRHV
jgi:hypothetical protein